MRSFVNPKAASKKTTGTGQIPTGATKKDRWEGRRGRHLSVSRLKIRNRIAGWMMVEIQTI